MELHQPLDACNAEFARAAPASRPALYDAKIEGLHATIALERTVGLGDLAPEFRLPDAKGRVVSVSYTHLSLPTILLV